MTGNTRRGFLKTLGVGLGAGAAGAALPLLASRHGRAADAAPGGASADRPNFVIILADDMGINGTSVYGGWIATPQLERLAAQGVKFTDFHSSGAVCSPTRAGLLTGRYQERAGIPNVISVQPNAPVHYAGLQPGEVTFPKLLKEAGYTSGIIGKWHLGYDVKYNPLHHGFDRFRGYVSGNIDYISHHDGAGDPDWWDGLQLAPEEGYTTHLIQRHSVKFIEDHKDRPFCLYMAHEAVHSPFQGPDSPPERSAGSGAKAKGATPEERVELYRQMMTEMDKSVGAVLDTLERLGLSRKTLVFFFSDNGAADGPAFSAPSSYKYPLRGRKGMVFEGGHRVPAIAAWPGRIKPGTVNNDTFISLDIMPTLLELAGARAPEGHRLDGVSMAPALLEGKPAAGERRLFWRGQAMREGKWKFVAGNGGGLFDLEADLAETTDLSARYPERASAMAAALEAWKTDVATGATPQPRMPAGVEPAAGKKKKKGAAGKGAPAPETVEDE